MKTISIQWLQALDADEVDEAMEEACVDCYGEDEQYAIAAHSVELVKPLPEGHLYLAALLQWRSKQ